MYAVDAVSLKETTQKARLGMHNAICQNN